MSKRNFEQAFNAVFHDNELFSDFCSADMSREVKTLTLKDRTIYKPSPKLKRYLRFIDKVALRYLGRNDAVVHSYIKEKSALTAVRAHASSKCFFLTDIEKFFNNITQQDVRNILETNSSTIPISDFQNYINIIVGMTVKEGSIPVGFPTSPQLSNAFLFNFDNALQAYCAGKSLVYTRYSDDIIISGQSFDGFDTLETDVQELLHTHGSRGLFLNPQKTHLTHLGNKVRILGLIITPDGNVTIDSKYKKTLESLLYFYVNDKARYTDFLDNVLRGKERSLFGLFHYAKSVDPQYLEKLQRKYGAYALSALMEDKWSERR